MSSRLDGFRGDDAQYIAYLEQLILRYRETDQRPSRISERGTSLVPFTFPTASINGLDEIDPHIAANDHALVPQRRIPEKPQEVWEKKANQLVRLVPRAADWSPHLRSTGIHDAMRSGNAAIFMLELDNQDMIQPRSMNSGVDLTVERPRQEPDLINDLETYARTALRREGTAYLALALANFQKFLLLSACAVLYDCSFNKERILDVVGICLGKTTHKYCVRGLRAVKYMNQVAYTMDGHGYKNRTSELFLICTNPWYLFHAGYKLIVLTG